jgi:Glycosyl hydrolases family 28
MTIKIHLCIICFLLSLHVIAQDYKASFFGIASDGNTLNTRSIQKAIDHIHEKGGGRLIFDVGRFVTGSIYLKSNVTIHLQEGAVLVASLNPFDYDRHGYWSAMIFALDQQNIGITGKGSIDGRGYELAQNVLTMVHKGLIADSKNLDKDRAHEGIRPQNIYFKGCKNIVIKDVAINNSASWVQQYDQCKNIVVDNIRVDSKCYWNNDGIDIVDCDSVVIRNSYFDAADDGICLKSHQPAMLCQNINIYNNVVRSSASGIKFGTYSVGGFKNIHIRNNTVYDTYRSAITFAAVDGGHIENITVDSLKALNVGNVIFLRIGERRAGKKGSMKNIRLSNIYAEVAAGKADAGYPYEGPVEHLPRNISPASIIGMPDVAIENIHLKNIAIHYPGGGDPNYAKVLLNELDNVPELADHYPEYSMFKELPAWGFYIRHAVDLSFEEVHLHCAKRDYRTAVVLDDVQGIRFKKLKVMEPEEKKDSIFSVRSTGIVVE